MILVNLLPHREARRQARRRQFFVVLVASVLLGAGVLMAWSAVLERMSSAQSARNAFLRQEIATLDGQIRDISTLRKEIDELTARQKAVEDLQSNRNLPVHLFAELVLHVPEGLQLTGIVQTGTGVTLDGVAESTERVSELLRNLGRSGDWLDKPDLIEIRAAAPAEGASRPRLFQFSLRLEVRRPSPPSSSVPADNPAAGRPQA